MVLTTRCPVYLYEHHAYSPWQTHSFLFAGDSKKITFRSRCSCGYARVLIPHTDAGSNPNILLSRALGLTTELCPPPSLHSSTNRPEMERRNTPSCLRCLDPQSTALAHIHIFYSYFTVARWKSSEKSFLRLLMLADGRTKQDTSVTRVVHFKYSRFHILFWLPRPPTLLSRPLCLPAFVDPNRGREKNPKVVL